MDFLTLEILWQIIWYIALAVVFFAFKETDDKKLLIYLAIGSGIWGIHFSFLWLIAAAGINFFDVFKNIIGLKYEKNNYWVSFFILSYICIGIGTYYYTQNLISFLPTIASVLSAIAVFWFRGIPLRLILIGTLFVWFGYNFVGNSYAGMTSDIVLIWATFYGIFKLKSTSSNPL